MYRVHVYYTCMAIYTRVHTCMHTIYIYGHNMYCTCTRVIACYVFQHATEKLECCNSEFLLSTIDEYTVYSSSTGAYTRVRIIRVYGSCYVLHVDYCAILL